MKLILVILAAVAFLLAVAVVLVGHMGVLPILGMIAAGLFLFALSTIVP